jgi:hypothetical protein
VWWATFAAIVGGLLAAGIGGAIGGAVTRPANAQLMPEVTPSRPDVVVVEDRDDWTPRDERVREHEHEDDEEFATSRVTRTGRMS